MAPLSLLPYGVYLVLWTALLAGLALWLARPWPWALAMLCLPVIYEVLVGNIHLLIATSIVLGFRFPWVYVYPVWAKLTPAVGIGWWFVRAEWRAFSIAVLAVLGVGVVSFLLQPTAWADWLEILRASAGSNDALLPRAIVGVLLVAYGALTGRRWMVPVAVWISLPVVWINSWVILLAIIRLRERATPAAWLPDLRRDQLRDVEHPVDQVAGDRQRDGGVADPAAAAGEEPRERPAGGEVAGV
jgi:hypothetical protein